MPYNATSSQDGHVTGMEAYLCEPSRPLANAGHWGHGPPNRELQDKVQPSPRLIFLTLSRNFAYSIPRTQPASSAIADPEAQQPHQATQSQQSSRLAGRPFLRAISTANHVGLRGQ